MEYIVLGVITEISTDFISGNDAYRIQDFGGFQEFSS